MDQLTPVDLFPISESGHINPFPHNPYHWSILGVLTDISDQMDMDAYANAAA